MSKTTNLVNNDINIKQVTTIIITTQATETIINSIIRNQRGVKLKQVILIVERSPQRMTKTRTTS